MGLAVRDWGALPDESESGSTHRFVVNPLADRPRSKHELLPAQLLLPRKEVIQPHLPVQLPCYDFVPVIGPTLGTCSPKGLAWRLQVLLTSMT